MKSILSLIFCWPLKTFSRVGFLFLKHPKSVFTVWHKYTVPIVKWKLILLLLKPIISFHRTVCIDSILLSLLRTDRHCGLYGNSWCQDSELYIYSYVDKTSMCLNKHKYKHKYNNMVIKCKYSCLNANLLRESLYNNLLVYFLRQAPDCSYRGSSSCHSGSWHSWLWQSCSLSKAGTTLRQLLRHWKITLVDQCHLMRSPGMRQCSWSKEDTYWPSRCCLSTSSWSCTPCTLRWGTSLLPDNSQDSH